MVLFELVHLISGIVGLGAAIGLLGSWTDHTWTLTAAMWAALVAVAGSGIVLSLSWVGGGAIPSPGLLLAKVMLTVVLLGVMYWKLRDVEEGSRAEYRVWFATMLLLWVVSFGLGLVLV